MISRRQLLEPDFVPPRQGSFGPNEQPLLRFVIKLHRASRLEFGFRLEIFEKFLSFWLAADYEWDSIGAFRIHRTFDHDFSSMHTERCDPTGEYGAGPMLVWDYGTYALAEEGAGSEEIYARLLKGDVEIEIKGQRVRGRFRLKRTGDTWILERRTLAPQPIQNDWRSIKSGRSLDEIEQNIPSERRSSLWLEWRHFYADNETDQPQVVLKNHQVFDMNRAAAHRGVAVGMRKHQFRSVAQGCLVKEWTPDPEKAAKWMDICLTYSGCIEPLHDHLAAIDFYGHSSPLDLIKELTEKLREGDFGHLLSGLGPSKWVARLLAHRDYPLDMSQPIADILAPLPIHLLTPIPAGDLERLAFLGYRTIGEVAQISESILKSQFGKSAFAIGQAAKGLLLDEIRPLYPKGILIEAHRFPDPINGDETLQLVLKDLARRLAARLDGRQAGSVALWIEYEDHTLLKLERALKTPIYGVTGIWATLRTLVDQTPPTKPVTWLRVRLSDLEPVQSRQRGLFYKDQSNAEVGFKSLKSAYGSTAILKASEVQVSRRKQVLREWKRATGWE